jgi:hypothetical protein
MSPFRNYPQPILGAGPCCRSRRCLVCSSRPAQLLPEFLELVRQSWSPAEIDTLGKAARSALL